MGEMVERVARAICCKRIGYQCQLGLGGYGGEPGGRCGCGYTDDMRNYARAAIAAMGQPTEAMTSRAWHVAKEDFYTTEDNVLELWKHMIDEALK